MLWVMRPGSGATPGTRARLGQPSSVTRAMTADTALPMSRRERRRLQRRLIPSAAIVGLVLFGIAYAGALALIPDRCSDGWRSPSIGIQGACSSHGGLDGSLPPLRLALALAAGIAGGLGLFTLRRRRLTRMLADEDRRRASEARFGSSSRGGTG